MGRNGPNLACKAREARPPTYETHTPTHTLQPLRQSVDKHASKRSPFQKKYSTIVLSVLSKFAKVANTTPSSLQCSNHTKQSSGRILRSCGNQGGCGSGCAIGLKSGRSQMVKVALQDRSTIIRATTHSHAVTPFLLL